MLGYSDPVSINDYHQKAQFSMYFVRNIVKIRMAKKIEGNCWSCVTNGEFQFNNNFKKKGQDY